MQSGNISIRARLEVILVCVGFLVSPLTRAAAADGEKLKVVATISMIGDWAHQVGGDDISLTTLVGPDGDPHEYEPVPADSLKLAQAAVIFENGFGLETWLPKLCDSAQTDAARVVVTRGIKVRHVPDSQGQQTTGNQDDRDPHEWQNVRNAIVCVGNICDALVKADPPHADRYNARAQAYEKQLEELDSYIAAKIDSIPANLRKLVTSHDGFEYFGQRYGVNTSRSALESVTTEAADPSARQIAEVVDQIKASGVPVIFLENIQNPKLINQIASEANVKVGPPLYSDALGQPGTAGDTYLKMMKYNADTLANSLKP